MTDPPPTSASLRANRAASAPCSEVKATSSPNPCSVNRPTRGVRRGTRAAKSCSLSLPNTTSTRLPGPARSRPRRVLASATASNRPPPASEPAVSSAEIPASMSENAGSRELSGPKTCEGRSESMNATGRSGSSAAMSATRDRAKSTPLPVPPSGPRRPAPSATTTVIASPESGAAASAGLAADRPTAIARTITTEIATSVLGAIHVLLMTRLVAETSQKHWTRCSGAFQY